MHPFGDCHTNEMSNTMTYEEHCTLPAESLHQIAAEGFYALPELIRILNNSAMKIERQRFLGAGMLPASILRIRAVQCNSKCGHTFP